MIWFESNDSNETEDQDRNSFNSIFIPQLNSSMKTVILLGFPTFYCPWAASLSFY